MQSFLPHVAAILSRHPSPAMSLGEVMSHLRSDVPGVIPGPDAVLRELERDRDQFRVVSTESGERCLDRVLGRDDSGAFAPYGPVERGPWIICAEASPSALRTRAQMLVRDTVAHLGYGLDGHSARAVARWLGLLAECGRVGHRLRDPGRRDPSGCPSGG